MSHAPTDLHKAYREGQQKLSYFLLGVEAATFAYIGKDFVAEPIAFSRNTLELCGLLALALAIIFAVLALSAYLYVQGLNLQHLDLNTQVREFRLAAESDTPHIDFTTSKVLAAEALMAKADGLLKEYQELGAYMDVARRKTELIGFAHIGFLVLGFILLALSRSVGVFS